MLATLDDQSMLPAQVVLSVPTEESLPVIVETDHPFEITVVVGSLGSAAQRNAGICALGAAYDPVFFFDDDTVPRSDYLERARRVFEAEPQVVGLTGILVADGAATGLEVRRATAVRLLTESATAPDGAALLPVEELYGCNFAVRARGLQHLRFDENLPLYSWLEDLDFARRLARTGRLVRAASCVAAHLGSRSGGRSQHLRLGYSQVTNPIYLWRKGSIPLHLALRLILRPAARNLLGSVVGTEAGWRRQRLAGNLRSVCDLLRLRVSPQRILAL